MKSVFIGSSTEGIRIAQRVHTELASMGVDVTVWNQGVFGLGSVVIDKLMAEVDNHDFAVLVFTADDIVTSRGRQNTMPRDNVMFELGMFMSKLGPAHPSSYTISLRSLSSCLT